MYSSLWISVSMRVCIYIIHGVFSCLGSYSYDYTPLDWIIIISVFNNIMYKLQTRKKKMLRACLLYHKCANAFWLRWCAPTIGILGEISQQLPTLLNRRTAGLWIFQRSLCLCMINLYEHKIAVNELTCNVFK